MTEPLFETPGDTLLARGSADPFEQLLLTRAERDQLELVTEQSHAARTLAEIAVVLGAGFLLYRSYVARRTRDDLTPQNSKALGWIAKDHSKTFLPAWVRMATPALEQAYVIGAVRSGDVLVPDEIVTQFAERYALETAGYFNETSAEALNEGFNVYVNRKLPARIAAERALEGYGLNSKQMRALANKAATNKVDSVVALDHDASTRDFIEMMLVQRAHDIGDNEGFNVSQHGKQISWMYLQKHGRLPATAKKQWVTADDERVCKSCGPLHLKEVLVSESFETPYGKLWVPSMHPNCRCEVRLRMPVQSDFNLAKADDDDWTEQEHPRGEGGRFIPKRQGRPERQRPRPYAEPPVAERPVDPVLERLLREAQAPVLPTEIVVAPEEQKIRLGEPTAEEGKIQLGPKIRLGEQISLGQKIRLGEKIQLGEEAETAAAERAVITPEKIALGEGRVELARQELLVLSSQPMTMPAQAKIALQQPHVPSREFRAPAEEGVPLPDTVYMLDPSGFHYYEDMSPIMDHMEPGRALIKPHNKFYSQERMEDQLDSMFWREINREATAIMKSGRNHLKDAILDEETVRQVILAEMINEPNVPNVRDWAHQMGIRRENYAVVVYQANEAHPAGYAGEVQAHPDEPPDEFVMPGPYKMEFEGVTSDTWWPVRSPTLTPDIDEEGYGRDLPHDRA